MNEKRRGSLNGLTRRSFLTTSLMAAPAIALASGTFDSKTEQNWPGFRGPGAQGVADGYPTRADWKVNAEAGKPSGVLWRVEVPGLGHSSPIVWGNDIFVATAVSLTGKAALRIGLYGDVKAAQDNDEQKWIVLCFDKNSGK